MDNGTSILRFHRTTVLARRKKIKKGFNCLLCNIEKSNLIYSNANQINVYSEQGCSAGYLGTLDAYQVDGNNADAFRGEICSWWWSADCGTTIYAYNSVDNNNWQYIVDINAAYWCYNWCGTVSFASSEYDDTLPGPP
jgi:hypothetical protein